MNVANTILNQLGGNKFIAMTGAKNFIGTDIGLHFTLPKSAGNKITKVVINLDPTDTYTVKFGNIQKSFFKIVSSFNDVYCDDLVSLIESQTNLLLSL